MNYDKSIIDLCVLPENLSAEETYDLLKKVKFGDKEAKEKMLIHNIRLVLYEVNTKFKFVEFEKKDLVSIGNVGLIKAIDTFDITKKIKFSTYASRCIQNEIIMFLRKLSKEKNKISLEFNINEERKLRIIDIISSEEDIEEDYFEKEKINIIRNIINQIPERDREIIKMYFGFYDGKKHSQKELSEIFNLSTSGISVIIRKNLKYISKELKKLEIIDQKIKIK